VTEKTFAATQAERFRLALSRHCRRSCPTCEGLDAAAHPLATGAVVTVLRFRDGRAGVEGIATIVGAADEPDTYLLRFRGGDVCVRLVFPEYQRDPSRMIHVLNRHLREEISDDGSNSIEAGEENL
jgi:hypothetical protein